MAINISNFRIVALHGYKTVDIEINDNKLIIVGENGTGKTTVINFIYYFLSGQWHRMKDINFEKLYAKVNDLEFNLTRDDLVDSREPQNRASKWISRKLGSLKYERFLRDVDRLLKLNVSEHEVFNYFSTHYNLSSSPVRDFIALAKEDGQLSFEFEENETIQLKNQLKALVTEQILYLPTYRRIEHELKSIFPQADIEDVLEKINRKRNFEGRHIELIEFGMQDVDTRINEKMKELKDTVIGELNNLTGAYLGEIVGGKYKTVDVESISNLEAETVQSMLSRIDDRVLPEVEKNELKRILGEIKSSQSIENLEQRVIAHFLLKLFEVHKIQAEKEKNVNQFVEICNKYLVDKKLVYDNSEFKIGIELKNSQKKQSEDDDCISITLKQLSSGEKQIVSLFSHLFLSSNKQFFVLIDEPELSLSVPWQKIFLPDILKSGYCSGLIAVTHSPFTFENELDQYTHSISEFSSSL